MSNWQLVGPKIPSPVWYSRLLRARGLEDESRGIVWSRLRQEDWSELDARKNPGRTLLLVHGTGLRSQACFVGLTKDEYARLESYYGGRILAYEHCGLSHHLDRNSRDLIRSLEAGGAPLDLDVVALSRGGLVIRRITEGWDALREDIGIHKLVFVSTPNDGTPSARRDKTWSQEALKMQAWRRDVRRIVLTGEDDRDVEVYEDPFSIPGFEGKEKACLTWPVLHGTKDQVPGSPMLQILNGFAGKAPLPLRKVTYYAVASVFDFEHGAPNKIVAGSYTRRDVCDCAMHGLVNDLVVPTFGVFSPRQGADASGFFPLSKERLLVLRPSSNATHVGMFRVSAVRRQIFNWLGL